MERVVARKIKVLFVFSLLIILGFFIIPKASGSSEKNFNVPIYLQTSAGIEKANFESIADVLSNHDFEIKRVQEYVPDEECSLRGTGSLEIDGVIFNKVDLNLYIPLKNDGLGQGTLIAQRDRTRFSLDFEVRKILETTSEKLVFKSSGEGKLNKEKLNFDNITVTIDKINNKTEISGSGDKNFNTGNLEVTFIRGCSSQKIDFYLITEKNELGESRTTEEIGALLEQHSELVDMFEGLRNLNGQLPMVPEFGFYVGALTLLSAVAIFFFVRRK